ncbi:hypothetical protein ACP275_05G052800 [Erythranthe tilingii]
MKKANREDVGSNSMDMISELPKHILQRILYFLSQKDAVRTSVLSKSWRNIWCTRPNLDLRGPYLSRNIKEFLTLVENTLQRYCDQRLSLEEFHLSIWLKKIWYHELVSLLEKWIPRLTNMGMKEFRLSICSKGNPRLFDLDLPPVVFEPESLQHLHVYGFKLDRKAIERIVLLKNLRSLHLEKVDIEDDEVFQKIISNGPSIETMRIENCEGSRNINVGNLRRLKDFHSSGFNLGEANRERCSFEISHQSIETIFITHGNLLFHKGAEFRFLDDLRLRGVRLLPDNLSSCKFPSLKRLFLDHCDGFEVIELFIDAPKIKSFEYRGGFVPSITFATALNEWDSHIYVRSTNASSSWWFIKLNELLMSLSQSNIRSLAIRYIYHPWNIVHEPQFVIPDKPVVVESVKLKCDDSTLFSPLLNGVFRICRPRNISDFVIVEWDMDVIECLWKIFMERESGDKDESFRGFWKRELEEVSMEIYDDNRKEWSPTHFSELRYYVQVKLIRARFALKWRENFNLPDFEPLHYSIN